MRRLPSRHEGRQTFASAALPRHAVVILPLLYTRLRAVIDEGDAI